MGKNLPKVAVVTGGASGIGKAVALNFFKEHHCVVVCDKDVDALKKMKMKDASSGAEIWPLYLDVSRSQSVKILFSKIYKKFGKIDILVNSAGITTTPTLLIKKTDIDFKKVIDVHLMGTFYCMREAASYMIQRKFGRIINISSRAGVFGLYGKCNYSAAKAGIIGLSLTAAKELFHKGITVNVIAPGGITTPFSSQVIGQKKNLDVRLDLVVGEPNDVSHLVSFLAKEESYLINGVVILLDAGGHLWHGLDEIFLRAVKQTNAF
jgi:3-oxoacyl-[acyl-carrier protein] reductase